MSGYGGGDVEDVGRKVDPAWVTWAEEQTVRLLTAQRRLEELFEQAAAAPAASAAPTAPAAPAASAAPTAPTAPTAPAAPAAPAVPAPADDPIRIVDEIRLDDRDDRHDRDDDEQPDGSHGAATVRRPDGRRLVVRVHNENLVRGR